MKGDFSRQTFVKEQHYSGVLMQQGRVQVDADWNEQQAIEGYRTRTTTGDVVGLCGVPEESPGFAITVKGDLLLIGKGRYYVDGILVENEKEVPFGRQPHLPSAAGNIVLTGKGELQRGTSIMSKLDASLREKPELKTTIDKLPDKVGLVYLDVWQRLVTALDDAHIREKALNGPDTAARMQTIWQVRIAAVETLPELPLLKSKITKLLGFGTPDAGEVREEILVHLDPLKGCRGEWPEWAEAIAGSTGKLAAVAQAPSGDDKNPCLVPAGGGYRRLENQLYRVEIHDGGTLTDGSTSVKYKWSRENGSVAVRWIGQHGAQNEVLEIEGGNRDAVLGFSAGQWVELTDDWHELEGKPGTLVRLGSPDGADLTIDLTTPSIPPTGSRLLNDYPHNPKIRRWEVAATDATGQVLHKASKSFVELEDGVQVQFTAGTYHTGDYWLIPARTTGAEVEWPGRAADGEIFWPPYPAGVNPSAEPPLGVRHHYCRLAVVYVTQDGDLKVAHDCRPIFPPLTGLEDMVYAGGDGQSARPDPSASSGQAPAGAGLYLPLDMPLRVQVLGSTQPIEGAVVRFEALNPGELEPSLGAMGKTSPPTQQEIATGPSGIAQCYWKLFDGPAAQRVRATLVSLPGGQRFIPRDPLRRAAQQGGRGRLLPAVGLHPSWGPGQRAGCHRSVGRSDQPGVCGRRRPGDRL